MSQRQPPAKGPRKPGAFVERRADPDGRAAPGSLRHLKGLLGRPIGFERRDGHLHVVLVERRRAPRSDAKQPTPAQLCAELRERLLVQRVDNAAQVMRHLIAVHDKLAGRGGWAAVGAMPARLLARAGVQIDMLIGDEPAPLLGAMQQKLRLLQAAAELREERAAKPAADGAIEVSETTQEAFDEIERSWLGVAPADVPPRD